MDRMQPPPYYGSPYQGEMPPSSYPYPTPGERKEDSEPTATELSGNYFAVFMEKSIGKRYRTVGRKDAVRPSKKYRRSTYVIRIPPIHDFTINSKPNVRRVANARKARAPLTCNEGSTKARIQNEHCPR